MNLPVLQADYVTLRDSFEALDSPQTADELVMLVETAVDLEIMAACIRRAEERLLAT